MMGKNFWLKLSILTVALIGVVFIIDQLRSNGIPDEVVNLGEIKDIPRPVRLIVSKKLDWCETRVSSFHLLNGPNIFQKDNKWLNKSDDKTRELDFLEVEKWFGKYCSVTAFMRAGSSDNITDQPIAKVSFIDGKAQDFLMSPTGWFVWQGNHFRSPELTEAFLELRQLTSK